MYIVVSSLIMHLREISFFKSMSFQNSHISCVMRGQRLQMTRISSKGVDSRYKKESRNLVNGIINCTNHEIMIDRGNDVIIIPPSGNVARVLLTQDLVDMYYGIPVFKSANCSIIKGLPDPQPDTIYVTSSMVAQFAQRDDVVCPNHAPDQCKKDHYGKIISIKSFLRYV